MDIDKAIELLNHYLARPSNAEDRDLKEAVKMGRKALQLFAHDQGHRLDDLSLQLLLRAERRRQRG